MKEEDKGRLRKHYAEMSDEELSEMLSVPKEEYEPGVYDLILEEAKHRGIDTEKRDKTDNESDKIRLVEVYQANFYHAGRRA